MISNPCAFLGNVHKRDKEMVLEKCATADRSPAAVKIEERIGWESLWENVHGERCMRKIWWLVKALCHPCNGEDCPHPHVTISDGVLNSIRSYSTVVFIHILYRSPFGVIRRTLNFELARSFVDSV